MKLTGKISTAILGLSLCGAGCTALPTQTTQPGAQKPSVKQEKTISNKLGFGKLPKLDQSQLTTSNASGTDSSQANPVVSSSGTSVKGTADVPAAEFEADVLGTAAGISSVKIMPYPPIGRLPVTVEYQIDAELPPWQAEDNVLKLDRKLPDTTVVSSLARQIGLPAKAMADNSSVTALNFLWRDADALTWSLDVGTRQANFWQENNYPVPMPAIYKEGTTEKKPSYDKNDILTLTDAFLDAHGFTSIRMTGGKIQEDSWAESPLSSYRCPMLETSAIKSDATNAQGSAGASSSIYPSDGCNYWPQTVTVVYGGLREGRQVVDMGGNLSSSAYLNVNLTDKKIMSGNIQLEQTAIRSAYPLINSETAKKRLAAGGLNPVYAWGSENGNIKVTISSIALVWLRYDSWTDGKTTTYLIPALLASGTVQRGKGAETEKYSTTLPLVDDGAFEEIYAAPVPVPMPAEVSPPANSLQDIKKINQ